LHGNQRAGATRPLAVQTGWYVVLLHEARLP
jgi:hypothetical protein